jgi:hypothetical protein
MDFRAGNPVPACEQMNRDHIRPEREETPDHKSREENGREITEEKE